jgi:hypothetical protein
MGEASGDDHNDAERLRILQLLEQQKITATEAAELLAALGDRRNDVRRRDRGRWINEDMGPAPGRARWFHVRVTDQRSGVTRTDVQVPIGMIGFGLAFASKFRNVPGIQHVDDLFEAVRSGRRGVIFDVAGSDGERVEIFID